MLRFVAVLAISLISSVVAWPVYVASAQNATSASTAAPREQGARRAAIRFLTDSDFPPFNFLDEEGSLTGFHVDLARAICAEASATCDVQSRPWADLLPALARGEADAVIAGHAITPQALKRADFSDRYLPVAARFATSRSAPLQVTSQGLDGKRIGVVRATAHEAYARAFFRDSRIEVFATADLARDALSAGRLDAVFDDGVSLIFWVAGTNSKGCCELAGGPFIEPRYFGDGMAVALAKGDLDLARTVNAALKSLRESGRLEELLQRYFPARLF
jgi:polar amino acid transport system substrate-binding protein